MKQIIAGVLLIFVSISGYAKVEVGDWAKIEGTYFVEGKVGRISVLEVVTQKMDEAKYEVTSYFRFSSHPGLNQVKKNYRLDMDYDEKISTLCQGANRETETRVFVGEPIKTCRVVNEEENNVMWFSSASPGRLVKVAGILEGILISAELVDSRHLQLRPVEKF